MHEVLPEEGGTSALGFSRMAERSNSLATRAGANPGTAPLCP